MKKASLAKSFLPHGKSSRREKAVTPPGSRLVPAGAQCASAGQWTVEGTAAPGGDSRLAWGAAQTCSGVHGATGGAGVLVGAVHTHWKAGAGGSAHKRPNPHVRRPEAEREELGRAEARAH